MTNTTFSGVDQAELSRMLERGIDHGGNVIEPYIDTTGGLPLRCCLDRSTKGEQVTLVAWSPFEWKGVYAETGPIFVHATPCAGHEQTNALPADFDAQPMVLRPYTHDHRIAYHRVRHVEAGSSLSELAAELLDLDDVDFVHGRNVTGGCYAFEARRVET